MGHAVPARARGLLTVAASPLDRRSAVHIQHLSSGVIAVRATGMIDSTAAPHVQRRLTEAIRQCRVRPARVRLDLSGVVFLDRAGLDILLQVQDRLIVAGGILELAGPSPSVVRLVHEAHWHGEAWMTATK